MDYKRIFKAMVVLAVVLMQAVSAYAYDKQSINIRVNGKSRNMVVFTPKDMEANLPLMIVTHGMNQDPEYQMGADKMYEIIDAQRFALAYLRSDGNMWDTGGTNDQKFVEQAIVEMYTRYDIDPHRVYWTGFSMGSMLMYHCMHNMQGKIAAFAPTSGIQFSEQPWNKCTKPVNLIHIHAYGDDVFGYDQYGIRDYVFNMAKMNNYTSYEKKTNYKAPTAPSWLSGDKEIWTNDNGNQVVLFSFNNGGHYPKAEHSLEVWNFCKQFSIADEDLDPIEKGPLPGGTYSVDPESEFTSATNRMSGQVLFPTDVNCEAMWYVNNTNDSPQNVVAGTLADYENNPVSFFKFTSVSNPGCTTTGSLYTIQMADQDGGTYSLWGSNGYLNTPPSAFCLFALGITEHKYGQDADYHGLWKVTRDGENGYTIQNVGYSETSGTGAYISPVYATPVNEKVHVRLFKKLLYKAPDGIEDIRQDASTADGKTYDLMGRVVTSRKPGTIYIRNGRKFVETKR